jgi:transposase
MPAIRSSLAINTSIPEVLRLDLATHQSGQFRGQTKLSKFGNARLRRAFWVAAQVAIRQRDNSLRRRRVLIDCTRIILEPAIVIVGYVMTPP